MTTRLHIAPSAPLRLLPWDDVEPARPVDYHLHTTHTDGKNTIRQMTEAAASAGIREILFSEHVRHTSTYFPGFINEIENVAREFDLTLWKGCETKIMDFDGTLDCSDDIASACDAVIGSVHYPPVELSGGKRRWPELSVEKALDLEFKLAMAIVARSPAHILGHPMGMTITTFQVQPLEQLSELAAACRHSGKAFELNPRYCGDPKNWIELVKQAGCKVSFGSDAHIDADVGRAWKMFVEPESVME